MRLHTPFAIISNTARRSGIAWRTAGETRDGETDEKWRERFKRSRNLHGERLLTLAIPICEVSNSEL